MLINFYSILATIQYFKFQKSGIVDQFVTFCKRVYIKSTGIIILPIIAQHCFEHDSVVSSTQKHFRARELVECAHIF